MMYKFNECKGSISFNNFWKVQASHQFPSPNFHLYYDRTSIIFSMHICKTSFECYIFEIHLSIEKSCISKESLNIKFIPLWQQQFLIFKHISRWCLSLLIFKMVWGIQFREHNINGGTFCCFSKRTSTIESVNRFKLRFITHFS